MLSFHPTPQPLAPSKTRTTLKTLVVIDPKVEDYQNLASGVNPDVEVMILDAQRDGVTQITRALKGLGDVVHLHIVAHGKPGCLHLGNTQLSAETIGHYRLEVMGWFLTATAVRNQPTLSLYGCEVAAGEMGRIFLQRLRNLSGATVAASSTPVGAAQKGGNWELDVIVGAPSHALLPASSLPFYPATLRNYRGLLSQDPPKTAWLQTFENSGDDAEILRTSSVPARSAYTLSFESASFFDMLHIAAADRDTQFSFRAIELPAAVPI